MEENAVLRCQNGYTGPAVERLARFEAMAGELRAEQKALGAKLAVLRGQGKERSVQFRELLAQKLTNSAFLALLDARGLESNTDHTAEKATLP